MAIVLRPAAGAIRDRFGTRVTLLGILSTGAVTIGLLPVVSGSLALVLLTLGASATLAVWPVANAYIAEVALDDIQDAVVGITRTAYIGLDASGPIIVGILKHTGRLELAFYGIGGLLAVALIPAMLLPSSPSRE